MKLEGIDYDYSDPEQLMAMEVLLTHDGKMTYPRLKAMMESNTKKPEESSPIAYAMRSNNPSFSIKLKYLLILGDDAKREQHIQRILRENAEDVNLNNIANLPQECHEPFMEVWHRKRDINA